jgi:hypothetical protein
VRELVNNINTIFEISMCCRCPINQLESVISDSIIEASKIKRISNILKEYFLPLTLNVRRIFSYFLPKKKGCVAQPS